MRQVSLVVKYINEILLTENANFVQLFCTYEQIHKTVVVVVVCDLERLSQPAYLKQL